MNQFLQYKIVATCLNDVVIYLTIAERSRCYCIARICNFGNSGCLPRNEAKRSPGTIETSIISSSSLVQVKPTGDIQAARDTVEALQGPEGSALSEPQLRKLNEADQKLAKPADAGRETPHNATVLSDVALQAGVLTEWY